MVKSAFYSKDRLGKILLYMLTDAALIDLALLVATGLWYGGNIPGSNNSSVPQEVWSPFLWLCFIAPVLCITIFWCFRLYSNLWKYASIDEIFKIFLATTLVFLFIFVANNIYFERNFQTFFPRRLLFTAWLIFFAMFTFTRFGYRAIKRLFIFLGHTMTSKAGCKRVMVIGAGYSGYGLVKGMLNSPTRDRIPIIIVDDDDGKNNTNILGIRVLSAINTIVELAIKYQIDEIIIAKTSATDEELQLITKQCTQTDCTLKILPPISDISDGQMLAPSKIRDLNISDLLFREEVTLDTKNIKDYLSGRTVLVTGGGGSIGSELCRQIARFEPALLVIFDIYENNAYMLAHELKSKYKDNINIKICIGSIRDVNRLDEVFKQYLPNVIFHAAAHKHVPLMEDAPGEAVKNNVFGAYNVVKCADKYGAERFVMLSTDKAVNPANVMGATKRITEIIMQCMAVKSKTKFMAVRFGNVLGSNGSIIPLFQQQIASGGPVTVTHPDIERYFMTIPEASSLVLQAASLGKSGRIFVLDMGKPVKIDDLAKNIIKLSGLRLGKDIDIVYTGIRFGEKLYEELILDEEKDEVQITCHKKIFMTKPTDLDYDIFEKQLDELYNVACEDPSEIEHLLKDIVPTFNRNDNKEV